MRPGCNRSLSGEHEWKRGLCYDYCGLCGLVDAGPPETAQEPPWTVNGTDHRPKHKSAGWEERIKACWERDGSGCFYCGRELLLQNARLDHFIPRSKGGPDGLANRRAACRGCDGSKGNRMPWEFMPSRFEAPVDA